MEPIVPMWVTRSNYSRSPSPARSQSPTSTRRHIIADETFLRTGERSPTPGYSPSRYSRSSSRESSPTSLRTTDYFTSYTNRVSNITSSPTYLAPEPNTYRSQVPRSSSPITQNQLTYQQEREQRQMLEAARKLPRGYPVYGSPPGHFPPRLDRALTVEEMLVYSSNGRKQDGVEEYAITIARRNLERAKRSEESRARARQWNGQEESLSEFASLTLSDRFPDGSNSGLNEYSRGRRPSRVGTGEGNGLVARRRA